MQISATNAIAGRRVLHTIGKIEAASPWHAAEGGQSQADWREIILRDLVRKAEDFDADAIIEIVYETDGVILFDGGVRLIRILAIGTAVKLSCAA
jgi:uncharacterized protein YbjQ (UPF0145 family)